MITPVCSKYVSTPKLHIPIGKAILKDDGTYILRVKKPKKNEYVTEQEQAAENAQDTYAGLLRAFAQPMGQHIDSDEQRKCHCV